MLSDLEPLGPLRSLTSLDVSRNSLDTVLDISPSPVNLRTLDLSDNLVASVPDLSRSEHGKGGLGLRA